MLAQIHVMHNTQVSLESYAQVHGARGSHWQAVAADPKPFLALGIADARWLERALPILIRQEERCRTDGESLTHWDLRSDNICLTQAISRKGSPLVPALCLPAGTSPQRGEAGGGRCHRLVAGGGEVTAHAVPPSNLPPLGGGNGHKG